MHRAIAASWKLSLTALIGLSLGACSGAPVLDAAPEIISVTRSEEARAAVAKIPLRSVRERFETLDAEGHPVIYLALTDTDAASDIGALLFRDGLLWGTIGKTDAASFYACRGYQSLVAQSAVQSGHWAENATRWLESLLPRVRRVEQVMVSLTGRSTYQSIEEAAANPLVSQARSLLDVGSNPLGLIRLFNQFSDDAELRAKLKRVRAGLEALRPGAPERAMTPLVSLIAPDETRFPDHGMVVGYPLFSMEFYFSGGQLRTIQYPSLVNLARTRSGAFFVPEMRWENCTPERWADAAPITTP